MNNTEIKDNNKSYTFLKIFILIVCIVSALGAGVKIYKGFQATPNPEWTG